MACYRHSEEAKAPGCTGLALALAAELRTLGHGALAKGYGLALVGDADENYRVDPDLVLGLVQFPTRAVFDANVSHIALLGEVETIVASPSGEERLVDAVVGFYAGLMDFRLGVAAAKLQGRGMTFDELSSIRDHVKSRAKFALQLSKRLQASVGSGTLRADA